MAVNESRESEINSELEMLRSRVLLEDVAEHLSPEGILGGSAGRAKIWMGTLFSPVAVVKFFACGDAQLVSVCSGCRHFALNQYLE